ncbi:hypothetical protein EBQ74_13050 [bacterium]|nr:hypothetical protein [bacterium]
MKYNHLEIVGLIVISFVFSGCQRHYNTPVEMPAVSSAPQVFRSYASSLIRQAEITNAKDINDILSTHESEKNQLSQQGEVSEVTPAAVSASFAIAGQVCGALKNKETSLQKAQRKAFKHLNLTPTSLDLTISSLANDGAMKATGHALTQMFLGRQATSEELKAFLWVRGKVFENEVISISNNSNLVQDLAVAMCLGIAVSLEALSI